MNASDASRRSGERFGSRGITNVCASAWLAGLVEDRRHRPHAELHVLRLVGRDLPLAVEREGGGAVAEERDRALVVDVGPGDAALVRLAIHWSARTAVSSSMPMRRAAVLEDRRAAELGVERQEDPPRRHAARLEDEPGLAGLVLDRLAGVEQPVAPSSASSLPPSSSPAFSAQLGVVVEDERVGVERDRVLAAARLAALPRLLEEAVGLEAVAREQLGRELLEQARRGERGQPRGVDDGDVRAAIRRRPPARASCSRGCPTAGSARARRCRACSASMSARISVSRSPSPPPNRCQNVTVCCAAAERRAGRRDAERRARPARRRRSGSGAASAPPGALPPP